ncbi:hypothetical protein BH09CHL1_BH09CHL1_33490 [soil metagenome]
MQSTYQSNPHPWQIGPSASRVLRWIFGFGFFSVHLGIYLIGGLSLLMVNLYRSPDDLWVGGPLVRWGVIVLIHLLGAIVTWAATTVMDVAKTTKRELNNREPYQPVTAPTMPIPSAPLANEPMAAPRPRFQPTLSTPIETVDVDDSKRFGFRGWKGDSPPPRQRTSPPGWTVMRPGDTAPSPSIPTTFLPPDFQRPASTAVATPTVTTDVPLAGDIGTEAETAGDSRWTWFEAAAEAWLTNRLEKPATPPEPVEPEPEVTPFETAETTKIDPL